jgi:hypothetical protein
MMVGNGVRAAYIKARQAPMAGTADFSVTQPRPFRLQRSFCCSPTRFARFFFVRNDTSCVEVGAGANVGLNYPVENASSLAQVAKKSLSQLL